MRVLDASEQMMFEKAVLPVVATGRDGSFRPVGTCWVFAIGNGGALAFSAAHIFDDVVRQEGRHQRHSPSTPEFFLNRPQSVALAQTYLKAVYRSAMDQLLFVDILAVEYGPFSDVAICTLAFQAGTPSDVKFEKKLSVYSGPIPVGSALCAVGYGGMEKTQASLDEVNEVATATMHKTLTFEHGVCRGYFNDRGPRGAPLGPCFEIDVPTKHGMSGGPILYKEFDTEIVSCGVVSRGTSFGGDESTMGSALWPAYALRLPNVVGGEDRQPPTLLDLAQVGWLDDKANGPSHFRISEPAADGSRRALWI